MNTTTSGNNDTNSSNPSIDSKESQLNRRNFIKGGAAIAAMSLSTGTLAADIAKMAVDDNSELTWMPAWQIRDLIANKDISALEVTQHFLSRIEQLEPKIHAFRALDIKGALAAAKQADLAVKRGEDLGPLHGVPVSVKDGNAVKGLPLIQFTSATTADDPIIAEYDAIPVERLRNAGAIVFGVNIMPGQGIGPGMPDLKNHPRNPWDLNRAPGSSSAGCGAATAAAMVPFTLGGDGGGSTRLPAALSGVFGFHTTPGRLAGVDYGGPALALLDGSRGPMTRNAKDAAIAMQVLAGADGRDPLSTLMEPAPDYSADLNRGVDGMRFAWTDDFGFTSDAMHSLPTSPAIISAIHQAAKGFNNLGAKVESTHEKWESFWPPALISRQGFGGLGVTDQPIGPAQLKNSLDVRQRNWDKFDSLLNEYDLILSATATFTAFSVEDWHKMCNSGADWWPIYTSHTFMFNWLGMPAASVPCGFVDGLPIGLQIIGRPHSEAKILRAAMAFMEAYPLNRRPDV